MAVFWIRLAGKTIKIESRYEYVKQMCHSYICDSGREDIRVICSEKDIEYERERETDDGEYTDDYLESLAVYRAIAEQMLEHSVFLMHGAVVAVGEEAFMLTAASGVGKTTRLNMWLEQVPDSRVVNGDKPLLRVTDTEILACGTPWAGKEKLSTNTEVPLRAILLLERAKETSLQRISFSEAFIQLFAQTYRPADRKLMTETLGLLRKLEHRVEFYRFCSNLEDTDMREIYADIRRKKGF